MIRLTLLALFVTFLSFYAWKDWYKSLCGLILLMAVIQHPDMPKSMLGIQGLNPWNILFASILSAWFVKRQQENLVWDMPKNIQKLLWIYLLVIIVGFFRLLGDRSDFDQWSMLFDKNPSSTFGLWSEYIINCIKWVMPGLLLFHGCQSKSRFRWALFSIMGLYLLLGIQVIRWMPLGLITSSDVLSERAIKILSNEVGYHRVNLSMMLAGASWAIFTSKVITTKRIHGFMIMLAALTVFLAQALTGGRTGYVTWAAIGLVLSTLRWRKYLVLAPMVIIIIISFIPAAYERMSQGFTAESRDTNVRIHGKDSVQSDEADLYTITSGRNIAWPYVFEKIGEAPFFGYGREAMKNVGLSHLLWNQFKEGFAHPHNAYLQWLLDNGWIGFLPVMYFYYLIIKYSMRLFKDSRNLDFIAIGGITLSLVIALMVASVGSQTFYPREGAVGMWCAIGLMLRVYVKRRRILEAKQKSSTEKQTLSPEDFTDENLWQRSV